MVALKVIGPVRIDDLEDRLANATKQILDIRTSDECPAILHRDLKEIETAVARVVEELDQFEDDSDCECPDCDLADDNQFDTLERVAKWLEGLALGFHPGAEQTFIYRELARDIRDGRINR